MMYATQTTYIRDYHTYRKAAVVYMHFSTDSIVVAFCYIGTGVLALLDTDRD